MKIALALLVGIIAGYIYAHEYVAVECQKLGGFFVGKRVYQCSAAPAGKLPDIGP